MPTLGARVSCVAPLEETIPREARRQFNKDPKKAVRWSETPAFPHLHLHLSSTRTHPTHPPPITQTTPTHNTHPSPFTLLHHLHHFLLHLPPASPPTRIVDAQSELASLSDAERAMVALLPQRDPTPGIYRLGNKWRALASRPPQHIGVFWTRIKVCHGIAR